MTDTVDNVTETEVPHEGIAPEEATKARKARKPVSESAAADKAKARAEAKEARDKARAEAKEAKDKAKAEAKEAKSTKEPKTPKEKPATVAIDGFELKPDADVSVVEKATAEIHDTLVKLVTKDKDSLSGYLSVGEYLSKVAPLFKSTKVYGAYIGKYAPELLAIDTAMRSNSKWLYENQNEVMRVLKVNNLADRSGNPTVLRQLYRKAIAEQEAAEEGLTLEEKEAKEKEEKKGNKKGMEEAITFALNAFLKEIDALPHKSAVKRSKDFIFGVLTATKREEVAGFVSSMYPMPKPKEGAEEGTDEGDVIEE